MVGRRRKPRPEDVLGPLEAVCMRSLWRRSPATVGDVLETVHAAYDPDLAYTTVMTVLSRLHAKGFVKRQRIGRGYRYEPAYTSGELVSMLSRREVDGLVERYGQVALAHFVDALRETDPDLLARVEALAEEHDRD